ncbi:MAG TPA: protease pro-enzyme activation domain-containing protein [Bryobacteraceae bacterium]|nr:protease pro-enzyme activation domain-containing protein [Bryobacteraceae bacterium]
MNRFFLRTVFLFVICSFAGVSLFAQSDRVRAAIDPQQRVALRGFVHPSAKAADDAGAVSDSFALPAMTLAFRPSATQQAALNTLLAEQQNPSSPNYHKWLTPEEFADRFGISASDLSKVNAWLTAQGFHVANTARGRTWVMFSGTAGQVKSAFATEIHRYTVRGQSHYANAAEPSIPAGLTNIVSAIRGLNDFKMLPHLRPAIAPNLTQRGSGHAMGASDFAAIYDVTPLYNAGIDGTGQKIAVVGQTDIKLSDITAFRTQMGLPIINLQQMRAGTDPGVSNDDLPEADLDIEWAGAIAKNATIVYVYSDDVWNSALYAVDNNVAPVITMSYGECEQADLVDLPGFRAAAQQANAQGMTWFASSGDSGATDCEDRGAAVAQNGLAIDVPGSIPEVTSMGGTQLNEGSGTYWNSEGTAVSYIPEIVWNSAASDGQLAGGGGGASVFFSRPGWQTGPGVPSDAYRHVPDVSFSASADHDGYYVYTGGSANYFGGTSVAAPTMAGVAALLNHYLVTNGNLKQAGLGNINPTLYRLGQTAPNVFHDVASGNNSMPCAGGSPNCSGATEGFDAAANYDQASGWGSVDVNALVHQWSNSAPTASAVVASLDQSPVFQQQPDASGNGWVFNLTLSEEAGIATTMTGMTINGVDYSGRISSLFGSSAIPAAGAIAAKIGLANLSVPLNVPFTFTGVDASGNQWNQQLSVPFQGVQTQLTIAGMSNAATGVQSYAPGMIMSIYGTAFGTAVEGAYTIPLPDYLSGFSAMINGVAAPLYYVSANQVNVQIPYETQPGRATLQIWTPWQTISRSFTVSTVAPGIFTFADGTLNPTRTSSAGTEIAMYITGEGAVTPSLATGATPGPRATTPAPKQPISITVGGVPVPASSIEFAGVPNGLVGVTQVNFTIPSNVPTGAQPVVVTQGTTSSPAGMITITQ